MKTYSSFLVIQRLWVVLVVLSTTGGIGGQVAWAKVDHDGQLWVPVYNRFTLFQDWQGWFEINPRFGDNISQIDQLLIRPAVGYQVTPSVSIWQGYAWITNYLPSFRDEHRLYQQLSYRRTLSKVRIFSRTRLEQRFVRDAGGVAIRAREMLRLDIPFSDEHVWGLVFYDELFVNVNTVDSGPEGGFDQNRFFMGIRRKVNRYLSFDLGYQNQTINTSGPNLADTMHHILLMQWFVDWGRVYSN